MAMKLALLAGPMVYESIEETARAGELISLQTGSEVIMRQSPRDKLLRNSRQVRANDNATWCDFCPRLYHLWHLNTKGTV